MSDLPEPWLRGPLRGVSPLLAPALYALQQAREDLARHTEGLSAGQVWDRPHGLASLGFHLRHIAGSVDRLTTYLEGRQLDEAQMAALAKEMEPGAGLDELLGDVDRALRRAEELIRSIDTATLAEPRFVGRKRLADSTPCHRRLDSGMRPLRSARLDRPAGRRSRLGSGSNALASERQQRGYEQRGG
ncbi:MAG: DinB family protein [Bryobacteraceae bacterium]